MHFLTWKKKNALCTFFCTETSVHRVLAFQSPRVPKKIFVGSISDVLSPDVKILNFRRVFRGFWIFCIFLNFFPWSPKARRSISKKIKFSKFLRSFGLRVVAWVCPCLNPFPNNFRAKVLSRMLRKKFFSGAFNKVSSRWLIPKKKTNYAISPVLQAHPSSSDEREGFSRAHSEILDENNPRNFSKSCIKIHQKSIPKIHIFSEFRLDFLVILPLLCTSRVGKGPRHQSRASGLQKTSKTMFRGSTC